MFAGNDYTCKLFISTSAYSEGIVMYNSTRPGMVIIDTSRVLSDLTTEVQFSVGGIGTLISYQVLNHSKEFERHSENLTFANSFTINFDPDYIALYARIWVLAGRVGSVNEFTIGVGSIVGGRMISHDASRFRFSCTFSGNVDYIELEVFFNSLLKISRYLRYSVT